MRWPASARPSRGEILLRGAPITGGAQARLLALRARARGPAAGRAGQGLHRLRERDPGLPDRARLRASAASCGSGTSSSSAGRWMRGYDVRPRRAHAGCALLLRRQPAEAGPRPRDGARPRPAAGRPADPRRRHRRDRVHPQAPDRDARRRQGRAAGLGRARRDPVARRPHPGDVRRHDHRRADARARPTSGASAC